MSSIHVELPDGSKRELPAGATAMDLAQDISEGLARQVVVAKVDGDDNGEARHLMDRARELTPDQSLLHALAGLLALNDADAPAAEAAFSRAIDLGHPDEERVATFHLWRGRARDLQGRRGEAEADYRRCLGHHADAPVHRAARKGLRRAYSARRARRVAVDMVFADVLAP